MDTKRLSDWALIFIAVVLLIFLLVEFKSFLMPLSFSIILALLFTPYLRLTKRDRIKKISTLVIHLVILIGIFTILFASFAFGTNDDSVSTSLSFEDVSTISIGTFEIPVSNYLSPERINTLFSSFVSSLTSFFSVLFTVLIILLFVIPVLNGLIKDALKDKTKKVHKEFLEIVFDLEEKIKQYLNVKTLVSLLTGFISLIVMLIFGVKYALIFGVLIFLFNYVPTIGSIVAVGIVLISELLFSGFSPGFLFMAILLILIQLIMGNIVEPKIAGKRLKISSLTVILSLFFWGAIWGIGGMFFSVLLTISLMVIVKHILKTKF